MACNERELIRLLLPAYAEANGKWMSNLLKDIGVLSMMPTYTVSELRELCKNETNASKAAKFGASLQRSLERISGHLEQHGVEFNGAAESRSIQRAISEILTQSSE